MVAAVLVSDDWFPPEYQTGRAGKLARPFHLPCAPRSDNAIAMRSYFPEHQIIRLLSGTLAAVDVARHDGESRADFYRLAVRDLIEKRRLAVQPAAAPKPRRKPPG
jgi:hypothetical protein